MCFIHIQITASIRIFKSETDTKTRQKRISLLNSGSKIFYKKNKSMAKKELINQ